MESRGKHRLQLVRHADGIDHVQVREVPQEEIRRRRLRQAGRQGSRLHHQFLPRAGVREDHPVRQDRPRSEIPEIVAGRRDQLRGDREPHGQRGSRDGSHRVHLRSHHVRGAQHEIRLLPELRLRRRDEAGRAYGMVLPELRLQRSLQAQHRAKNLWLYRNKSVKFRENRRNKRTFRPFGQPRRRKRLNYGKRECHIAKGILFF